MSGRLCSCKRNHRVSNYWCSAHWQVFRFQLRVKSSIKPDSLSLPCHIERNEKHGTAGLSFSPPCHSITRLIKQKKECREVPRMTLARGFSLNNKGRDNYTDKCICDVILRHIIKKMLIRQRTLMNGMCVYVPVHINVCTCVFIISVIGTRWCNRKPNLWPQHRQNGGGEQHHNCHITATTSSPPARLPEDEWEKRREGVGGTMGGNEGGMGDE